MSTHSKRTELSENHARSKDRNIAQGPEAHYLLKPDVVLAFKEGLHKVLTSTDALVLQQLLTTAHESEKLIEPILFQARQLVNGDAEAGVRFWLLLRQWAFTSNKQLLPDSLLRESYGHNNSIPDAPRLLDMGVLQDLISGAILAARSDSEEKAMMVTLRQLLDPFFRAEYGFNALQQSMHGSKSIMQTLTFEHKLQTGISLQSSASESLLFDHSPEAADHVGSVSDVWKDRVGSVKDHPLYPPRPGVSEWTDLWGCAGHGRSIVSARDIFSGSYHIDFISNPGACGGKEILITGSNFGEKGRVFFPHPDIGDPLYQAHRTEIELEGVAPIQWDNSAITVRVPVWAVSGFIRLNAFDQIVTRCLVKNIYKPGNDFPFAGGLAKVFEININGATEGTGLNGEWVIPPDRQFKLGYRATARQDVRVTVEVRAEDGSLLLFKTDLPGGNQVLKLFLSTDPGVPVHGTIILTATSDCGSAQPVSFPAVISVTPELQIRFAEITQGVQESSQAVLAGNAVPLAANKDTAVRVHLNCNRGGWFDDQLDNITGIVKISTNGGVQHVWSSNKVPVKIIKQSQDNDEKTTVNFVIPAGWCTPGVHSMEITVGCYDMTGEIKAKSIMNWNWYDKGSIAVRWLLINKRDSDNQTLVPLMDQFLRDTLMYFPSPVLNIGPAWKDFWNQPEDFTQAGAVKAIAYDIAEFKNCTGWNDFWYWDEHCSSVDDDAHWIAVIPPWVPWGSNTLVGSTPRDTGASVCKFDVETAAHELGHQMGLHHVNLSTPGNLPAAPFDDVGNKGYLTRFAFNIRDQAVIKGAANRTDNFNMQNPMTADLMAYLRPGFLTHTHWQNVFDQL